MGPALGLSAAEKHAATSLPAAAADHSCLLVHSAWYVVMQVMEVEPTRDQLRLLHATIKKVTVETEELRFNTAIAAMMEFMNGVYKWENR